jgi:hypothetical protein
MQLIVLKSIDQHSMTATLVRGMQANIYYIIKYCTVYVLSWSIFQQEVKEIVIFPWIKER